MVFAFWVVVVVLLLMMVVAIVTVATLVKNENVLVQMMTLVFSLAGQLAPYPLIYVILAG